MHNGRHDIRETGKSLTRHDVCGAKHVHGRQFSSPAPRVHAST